MTTYFHKLLLTTIAIGLSGTSLAMATDINAGNDHKAWTNFGRSSNRSATSRSYRATAPVIVQSEPVASAVAQAPTTRRAYSYEPSKQGGTSSGCTSNATSDKSTAAAPQATQAQRSFSYEPSYSGRAAGRGRNSASSGFSIDVGRRAKGY